MTIYFNLELNKGLSKPDYILDFNETNEYNYKPSSKLLSTIISIKLRNSCVSSKEFEDTYISIIEKFKNIHIVKIINRYYITYPKFNDLKFLKVFKKLMKNCDSNLILDKFKSEDKINYITDEQINKLPIVIKIRSFIESNLFKFNLHEDSVFGNNLTWRGSRYITSYLNMKYVNQTLKLYLCIDDENLNNYLRYIYSTDYDDKYQLKYNILNIDSSSEDDNLFDSLEDDNERYVDYKISKLIKWYNNLYNIMNETIE